MSLRPEVVIATREVNHKDTIDVPSPVGPFSGDERRGVDLAIYKRRDVRSRFVAAPVPDEVLARILDAAHHARPSGLCNPVSSSSLPMRSCVVWSVNISRTRTRARKTWAWGWVSIVEAVARRRLLAIPDHILIVGYLCLEYVSGFDAEPELETKGWEHRAPRADVIHFDQYGAFDPLRAQGLSQNCAASAYKGVR